MKNTLRYTIFNTKWGYFGLVAAESALLRTLLPCQDRQTAKQQLLDNLTAPEYEKSLFRKLQELITAYFEGTYIDFPQDIPILLTTHKSSSQCCEHCHSRKSESLHPSTSQKVGQARILPGFSLFTATVLAACRNVKFGQTTTYGQLARIAGHPKAARPVGRIMAKNPLPLIIPCHRVLTSNGQLGGFSAPGGKRLKKKMLELERTTVET